MTAACDAEPQQLGPEGYPGGGDNWWYQDPEHAGFAQAVSLLNGADAGAIVRVAHLDTGFDPNHHSLPAGLERELQRNFVDPDRPRDASDSSAGLFNNLGHGMGTLSILAGKAPARGGAPFAKVVPIRVANHVEVFYNSAVLAGFHYVLNELCGKAATDVHVITMSLGGLASQAWADAVNALYNAGVVIVCAAGNNFGNAPTRNIVYPARFNRVIAACGVMADQHPYADLSVLKMAGNYGPDSKMRTAVAAYTPNIPWARFGCPDVLRFNGRGTSAAAPQVAAAAALWLARYRDAVAALPEKWMRAEAARQALFDTGARQGQGSGPDSHLGMGALRVQAALGRAPNQLLLKPEKEDDASFALLRVLTGLGVAQPETPKHRMLELEALQLSQSAQIEALLPDPGIDPASISLAERMRVAQALASHPHASRALRQALQIAAPPATVVPMPASQSAIQQMQLAGAMRPQPPAPVERRIRVFAYDPSLGRSLETVGINQTTLAVNWEQGLAPGPVGEYVEVVDVDPASGCCYAPVDLNDPRLIASDGLGPSESNPQFHQQMAYAVSMTTIERFEAALGRVALWSPAAGSEGANRRKITEDYVQRLRIYPHALRARNAFYSPERKALLLGYFTSDGGPGTAQELVFAALSHDIVAHETAHALLDGLHRRFREPTNPDVLAFHEAFADIVALFQHFSLADSLRDAIVRSRGDLSQENLLAKLAVQFGTATGHYGALRDAIGRVEHDPATGEPVWKPHKPQRDEYNRSPEPHERGAVLVAAVFDAFLQIYKRRAQKPIGLATGGSGVLAPGALPPALGDALAELASKVAAHVLTMCIRALDYCPPIDITFGDYLRALVTADRELVPLDPHGYRVAFVAAFAARGIYPEGLRSLSVETILWEPPPLQFEQLDTVLGELDLAWDRRSERHKAWMSAQANAIKFHRWLVDRSKVADLELGLLGLRREAEQGVALAGGEGKHIVCDVHGIEVHSVRPSRRVGPDGQVLSQAVVEITQSYYPKDGTGVFRAGVTLIIDVTRRSVVYLVRKRIDRAGRISDQQAFSATRKEQLTDHYRGLKAVEEEPFQFLHRDQGGSDGRRASST
jgi:hypothetical protein